MTTPVDTTGWTEEPSASGLSILVSPDGLTVYSPRRGRCYQRAFNHTTAREWVALGYTRGEIARTFGVSVEAVFQAIDPHHRAVVQERTLRAKMSETCEMCGGPTVIRSHRRHSPDDRILCHVCRNITRRTGVRYNGEKIEVRCNACRAFKPPEEFRKGPRYHDIRDEGFSANCRHCDTLARQAYRARHKIPCGGGCGRLVEGKGRANTRTTHPGVREALDPTRPHLCRSCQASRRA